MSRINMKTNLNVEAEGVAENEAMDVVAGIYQAGFDNLKKSLVDNLCHVVGDSLSGSPRYSY